MRGSRPGERRGGRKKGTPNRATARREVEIAASGMTPLEFMLSVMRDPGATRSERLEAAKAAAPFVHPKLATIEHKTPVVPDEAEGRIEILRYLTPDQREQLRDALTAAASAQRLLSSPENLRSTG